MPPIDDTRPPTPHPPAPKLDVVVYGVETTTVTVSGISCDHGDYDTLELDFGPDATVTLAGHSRDDLAHLTAAMTYALTTST